VPERCGHDAGGDTERRDNVGKVRTQLLDKGLLAARASQEAAVERSGVMEM
jgi:hypothetical protein